jgi:hypothetical protein
MRKILTIALVALMAASLFAGVKTSGYVQGAAHADFYLDDSDPIAFATDSDNKAQVNITDENKVWGTSITAQSDKFITKTWLDVMKVAKSEGDVAVKVNFLTWDRITTLSAYTNNADDVNTWRLRTDKQGEGVNVELGFQKMVKAQVGMQFYEEAMTADNREDKMSLLASVLATPVDGVKASFGYRLYNFEGDNNKTGFVVAAEADVAKLADLDFSLAAGVAYKRLEASDDGELTAQVFGEYEGISGYVELGFLDVENYLRMGAGYAFNDKLDANAYLAFYDYSDIDFDTNVTIGAEANYVLNKQISFYGNVEYGYKNDNAKQNEKNIAMEGRVKVKF